MALISLQGRQSYLLYVRMAMNRLLAFALRVEFFELIRYEFNISVLVYKAPLPWLFISSTADKTS